MSIRPIRSERAAWVAVARYIASTPDHPMVFSTVVQLAERGRIAPELAGTMLGRVANGPRMRMRLTPAQVRTARVLLALLLAELSADEQPLGRAR